MKRVVGVIKAVATTLLLISVSACSSDNYPSRTEASNACDDWLHDGKRVTYQVKMTEDDKEKLFWEENPLEAAYADGYIVRDEELFKSEKKKEFLSREMTKEERKWSRQCEEEIEINQFLGYENAAIKDGIWKNEDGKRGSFKTVKYFRY